MTTNLAIDANEFRPDCLIFDKVKVQNVPGSDSQKYTTIPLLYLYRTKSNPDGIRAPFAVNLPAITALGGIRLTVGDNGREKSAIMTSLQPGTEAHNVLIGNSQRPGFFDALWNAVVDYIHENRTSFGGKTKNTREMTSQGISPLYKTRENAEGEVDHTSPVLKFFNVYSRSMYQGSPIKYGDRGWAGASMVEPDLDSNGIPIQVPWAKLIGQVNVEMIPRISITNIYCGPRMSIQTKLESGIIRSVNPTASGLDRVEEIKRMRLERPDISTLVKRQLHGISREPQSVTLETTIPGGGDRDDLLNQEL